MKALIEILSFLFFSAGMILIFDGAITSIKQDFSDGLINLVLGVIFILPMFYLTSKET